MSGTWQRRSGALARERILVLDGAWGTMVHGAGLAPEDYGGERFATHPIDVAGDPGHPQPDAARTSSARSTSATSPPAPTSRRRTPSRRRRSARPTTALEDAVYEMNVAGARIAREAAGDRFVAGSVGPLNVTLSLSPKVDDPSFRTHTFDQVKEAYAEQMRGARRGRRRPAAARDDLRHAEREGGDHAAREMAPELPLWISATIVDLSGRTLSGQTIEAFWASVEHAEPLIVGVNCALGAHEMRPYVAELAHVAPCLVSAHPNAGLPNAFGGYDETPEVTSTLLREFAEAGFLNVAGSCCGSTPEHTAAIAAAVGAWPRDRSRKPARRDALERARAVRDRPGHRLRADRRADERDRLGPVPRALVEARRLHRRGRGRARAGARRRERARREHGRGPARERARRCARS